MYRLSEALLFTTLIAAASSGRAENLIKDGGFEAPVTPSGSYTVYNQGQKFGHWSVVGAAGNVSSVSTTFVQNGFTFDSRRGMAFMDLTGTSNTTTGVSQEVNTIPGTSYALTFWVGNVYDPNGIFGTTSTVDVYNGSTLLIAATNAAMGSTKQVWKKFSVTFVASGTKTDLSFINGDPSNDTLCGLDEITLVPGGGSH